jgi:GNAT superfamily N-acetyltransferase
MTPQRSSVSVELTETAANQGFWKGCFPEKRTLSLTPDECLSYGAHELWMAFDDDVPGKIIAPMCGLRLEWVGDHKIASDVIQAELLTIAQSEPTQGWNPRYYNFVGKIYDNEECTGEPAGFLTFNIQTDDTKRGLIKEVHFEFDLIFVRPEHRGRGLGQLASAVVGAWLRECQVYGAGVSKSGVALTYSSEIHGEGGALCSAILRRNFENLLEEGLAGQEIRWLGWDLRRVNAYEDY